MNLNLNCYWIDRNYKEDYWLHGQDKWCWQNCGNPINSLDCIDGGGISFDHTQKRCNCTSNTGNTLYC